MLSVKVIVVEPATEEALLLETAMIVRSEMLEKEHSRFLFMSKHRCTIEAFIANTWSPEVDDKCSNRGKHFIRLFNEGTLHVKTFDQILHGFRVGSYNHPDHGGIILDCTNMRDNSLDARFQYSLIQRMSSRKSTIAVLVGPNSKPFTSDGPIAKQIISDWNDDV